MRLEFASRITYEAREDLTKDGASQLPRAISTDGNDDDDTTSTASLTYIREPTSGTTKRNLLQLGT